MLQIFDHSPVWKIISKFSGNFEKKIVWWLRIYSVRQIEQTYFLAFSCQNPQWENRASDNPIFDSLFNHLLLFINEKLRMSFSALIWWSQPARTSLSPKSHKQSQWFQSFFGDLGERIGQLYETLESHLRHIPFCSEFDSNFRFLQSSKNPFGVAAVLRLKRMRKFWIIYFTQCATQKISRNIVRNKFNNDKNISK